MLPTSEHAQPVAPIVIGLMAKDQLILEHLQSIAPKQVAILNLNEDLIDSGTLFSCDGVIAVLDGNIGISPEFITSWQVACDHDLPRLILAVNTVNGRADFDEAIALSELVLNEDIAMRYYPIEDDNAPKYIGLLDVLMHEILQPGKDPIQADQEHINLTVDEHEELVDLLAHADLSDGVFESHISGMPISLPRLRKIWDEASLVTVLPIDQWVSDEVIKSWLNSRNSIWHPVASFDQTTISINESDKPLGIGIGNGIARMWPSDSSCEMELKTQTAETVLLSKSSQEILLFDSRIRLGDTIRPVGSTYLVVAPSI